MSTYLQKSNLNEILHIDLGVDSKKLIPVKTIKKIASNEERFGLFIAVNYLPLELFDNEEYDCQ